MISKTPMRLFRAIALLGVTLFAVDFVNAAGPVRIEHSEAELVSELDAVVPGQAFTVALRLKPDPDWYTQWRSASIEWTLPEGFVAGAIQEQVPDTKYSDYYNTPQGYGYSGEIFLLVEITPPATLEPGAKVELAAKVSWDIWKKRVPADIVEASFALELPVTAAPGADTPWGESIRKARATSPALSTELSVTGYREDKQLTLVIDAVRDLNPDARNCYFFEDHGLLEAAYNSTAWRTSRQVRILVRDFYHEQQADRFSGVLHAEGGWFRDGAENHAVEFAVVAGAPPPTIPLVTLATAVTRSLVETPDYRRLRALYLRRRTEAGGEWVKSIYGRRLLATLSQLRAEAASATIVDPERPQERNVNFIGNDGRVTRLSSIVPSQVEEDESYLDGVGAVVSRFILEEAQREGVLLLPPLPPAAREALAKGIAAAKDRNYLLAVSSFEAARAIPYYSSEYGRNPRAPEIYFNLGLAESKLPGHELRAIAWFGAYLTADPYAPAPNEAAVLQQMNMLFEKNRANLAAWLGSVQEAAGTFSNGYQWVTLFQTVILWAEAGEIDAAQKAAALIPVSDQDYCFSLHEIVKAQLRAGDLAGARKTADTIKDRYNRSVASTTANMSYAGERTEVAFTLANAQVAMAEAQILAGEIAEGKKSLAAAQKSTALTRYATYESIVLPTIAEALIHAGEVEEAKAVLAEARRVVDGNPEPNAKVRELLGIARAQLLAGDTAGAQETFVLAQGMAGTANAKDFARQMAVAQAEGGDIAGAQTTIGLISNQSELDSARLTIVQAQLTRRDRDGANGTAFLIKGEYDKSRARLAIVASAEKRGSTPSDWLSILEESDRIQDCPLAHPIFSDLGGYLKSLGRSGNPSDLFEYLRGISNAQIGAKNTIGKMLGELTKK